MDISLDAWLLVAEFAPPRAVRYVKSDLWAALRQQSLELHILSLEEVPKLAASLQQYPTRDLKLNFEANAFSPCQTKRRFSLDNSFLGCTNPERKTQRLVPLLDTLQQSPILESLTLSLGQACNLLPGDVSALAKLYQIPKLRFLQLNFKTSMSVNTEPELKSVFNNVSRAPNLKHLGIGVDSTFFPAWGGASLQSLPNFFRLESLALQLAKCTSLKTALRALLALCAVPRLRTIRLEINDTSNPVCAALAGLKNAPALTSLIVQVGRTDSFSYSPPMGDAGAASLAELRQSKTLESFELFLKKGDLTFFGARALASFKECPTLHTLTLCIGDNPIGDMGGVALAGLREAPGLRRLTLGLFNCKLLDHSVEALAGLRNASALEMITLDVSHNGFRLSSHAHLEALQKTPGKQCTVLARPYMAFADQQAGAERRAWMDPTLATLLRYGKAAEVAMSDDDDYNPEPIQFRHCVR